MPARQTTSLTGILAAVPTPFTPDGNAIDAKALSALVERLIGEGSQGIVTTGTTGELTSLSQEEYREVVRLYVGAARGRVPVVVGLAALTTKEAIEMAKFAEQAGATAVMVVPPFYGALPFDTLLTFLGHVAESITIPIMYYNLPSATGIHLTAKQIREIGNIPGLDYLKDTSGNAVEQVDLLTHPASNIDIFNGWDTLTFLALASGAKGSVWGAATVVPRLARRFWETLAVEKDLVEARKQWQSLHRISAFLESVDYAAGIKYGCELVGNPVGSCRLPSTGLSADDKSRFVAILKEAGAL